MMIRRFVLPSTTVTLPRITRRHIASAGLVSGLIAAILAVDPSAHAAGPAAAVPKLTQRQGPWMIKTEAFSGENAEAQATELAIELRALLGRPTYLYALDIDGEDRIEGKGFDKFGRTKQMRYQSVTEFQEIIVLIGDFTSLDDPRLITTLDAVKKAHPVCITRWSDDENSRRFSGLRTLQDQANIDPEKRGQGPLRRAFATVNPTLPKEFYGAGGIDPFVVDMNKNAEFSLLRCPKKYTVRVATFRGDAAVSLDPIFSKYEGQIVTSKLEEAAVKAHDLAAALRKIGVEAYEFHDRSQSIVCVGSYDNPGYQRRDGSVEPNPDILRVVQWAGATAVPRADGKGQTLSPKSLGGIPLDVQPMPLEVPRTSVAQSLSTSNR